MKTTLPCKKSGCSGYVTYEEETISGVVSMKAVAQSIARGRKRVYLVCSNLDDPHEYPYEIEAALEDTSNDVFAEEAEMKADDAD